MTLGIVLAIATGAAVGGLATAIVLVLLFAHAVRR